MNRIPSTVKTMALAVALALPATSAFSASMSDIVTTRDDQDVHQQFGRDSVYAMQTRQPLQTESHVSSDSGVGKFFAGVGAAGSSAWHKMTSVFEPKPDTAVARQPEWFGRAGGYVGTDQLALLERAGPARDVSQPVTAGEAMAIAPAERDIRYPAATESQLYDRAEDRFPRSTEAAPVISTESTSGASEPSIDEQPVIANDIQEPAVTEIQTYDGEAQPFGRNEDQITESAAPSSAAVPSEPAEQPTAASDATMLSRDQDDVYDSAAAAGDESVTPGEATSNGTDAQPETSAANQAAQSPTEQEGAGESAQSAPSPDSVTVMDEEMSRLGEQAADEGSQPERSSGRL